MIVVRKMMSHMFKVWLNGESQREGCDRWLQQCCIQTCVEAQNKGRLPKRRWGGWGGGPRLLLGPFEAGQISNTALATSLA